eukprot:359671-Chlamydomonas_euryale.AAC.1
MWGWKLQPSSCHLVHLVVHTAPALHLAVNARSSTTADVHAAADVHAVAQDATAEVSESSGCDSDAVASGSDSDDLEGSDAVDEGDIAELGPDCDAQAAKDASAMARAQRCTCCAYTCIAPPPPALAYSLTADEHMYS